MLDDANMQRLNQSGLAFTKVEGAGTLQVQEFRFDPVEDGEPEIPQQMRSDGSRAGLYFIQLVAPVTDDWRQRADWECRWVASKGTTDVVPQALRDENEFSDTGLKAPVSRYQSTPRGKK